MSHEQLHSPTFILYSICLVNPHSLTALLILYENVLSVIFLGRFQWGHFSSRYVANFSRQSAGIRKKIFELDGVMFTACTMNASGVHGECIMNVQCMHHQCIMNVQCIINVLIGVAQTLRFLFFLPLQYFLRTGGAVAGAGAAAAAAGFRRRRRLLTGTSKSESLPSALCVLNVLQMHVCLLVKKCITNTLNKWFEMHYNYIEHVIWNVLLKHWVCACALVMKCITNALNAWFWMYC